MRRSHWAMVCLVLTACLTAGSALAQKAPGPEAGKTQPPVKEPELTLDEYKLPDNALVIICDSLAKAQKLIPRGVYLTLEKFQEYKELENKIKQLEGQLKPKKLRPHSCQLSGQLVGETIELEAKFVLVTDQPQSLVALGCQGSFLTKADMQGQFPFLQYNPLDGFVVQVPTAGKQEITLSLKVAVKSLKEEVLTGGVERSFTLGLPGAAVTPPLELKLPAQVKELRWNDLVDKQFTAQGGSNLWKIPLAGEMDKLKVSWKESAGPVVKGTSVAASWDVTVQLLKKQVNTQANLAVQDARGKAVDWRILVPKGATLELKGADPAYQVTQESTFAATALFRVKGPPAQQLDISVSVVQERQKTKSIPVGPFLLFGADRQKGDYEIQAVPEVLQGQRVSYHKHLDLRPADQTKAINVIDRFEAWDLHQGVAAPQVANAAKIGPHFELELKPLEAQVETRVEHTLRLQPAQNGWHLLAVSKIHVTPLFSIDFLDVKLPPPVPAWVAPVLPGQVGFSSNLLDAFTWLAQETEWPVQPQSDFSVLAEGPAALASLLPAGAKESVRRIDLKKPQTAPFVVTLTRKYWVAPQVQQLALDLPRPVSLSDKGAKVTLEIEDPMLEVVGVDQGAVTLKKGKQSLTTNWNAAPDSVRLAWQLFRSEFPVSVVADVTVQPRLMLVRQQLDFDFSQLGKPKMGPANTHQVQLVVPQGIGAFQVISGGILVDLDKSRATVEVSAKTPLVLGYDFALPQELKANGEPVNGDAQPPGTKLPLFWPETMTRSATKVRFWTELGMMLHLSDAQPANHTWKDTGIETVAGKNSLPILVVQSEELQPTLTIQLMATSTPVSAGVLVDRALMQMVVQEDGKRQFHGRFLITKTDTDTLEILFPLPLAQIKQSLSVRLDGKYLTPLELTDGVTARFKTLNPKLYATPVLLDIRYDIDPSDSSLLDFGHLLLQAPRFNEEVHIGRVRWQVLLPASQVPLVLGGQMHAPQQWRWQGWLFTPESQVTSDDLEQWITQQPATSTGQAGGIIFWGSGTNAVRLLLFPRQVWLLLCSGVVLLLGLGVSFLPRRRIGFWLLLVSLAGAMLVAALFWPGTVPAVLYGIQPGIVVLALILLMQWLLHERYRRQMLFMPGFSRMRKGSSIVRREMPAGRETSTIDAGPPPGSKVGSSKIGP